MQLPVSCAKTVYSPDLYSAESEAKSDGQGALEVGGACTAMGSSKVQPALVGTFPPPALNSFDCRLCVFLTVNEIS